MKKIICIATAIIAVAVMFFAFKQEQDEFSYVYSDNTPSVIPVSYEMPLNFTVFREYNNERVTAKVYHADSKEDIDGKEPEAVFSKEYDNMGDTISNVRFVWDTSDTAGSYIVQYCSSRYINGKWVDSDKKMYLGFEVVYPCTKHTFVQKRNSIYGTEGISSDCYTHGIAYNLCTVCGYEEPCGLELSHFYEISRTISTANCTDKGYVSYECTKCGASKVEVVEPNKDNHSIKAVGKVRPTATRPGSVAFECTRCGYAEPNETEIPALFMEIDPEKYYEIPVAWAYDKGCFALLGDSEFEPETECNRAMAITFMYLASDDEVSEDDENPFSDVRDDDIYIDAAKWAYKKDIVEGNEFKPDEICTRAMLVEYLWKMAGSPNARTDHDFSDIPEDASYGKAVSWAVRNGIASGMGDGIFDPNRKCTQAQVITFLYRIFHE